MLIRKRIQNNIDNLIGNISSSFNNFKLDKDLEINNLLSKNYIEGQQELQILNVSNSNENIDVNKISYLNNPEEGSSNNKNDENNNVVGDAVSWLVDQREEEEIKDIVPDIQDAGDSKDNVENNIATLDLPSNDDFIKEEKNYDLKNNVSQDDKNLSFSENEDVFKINHNDTEQHHKEDNRESQIINKTLYHAENNTTKPKEYLDKEYYDLNSLEIDFDSTFDTNYLNADRVIVGAKIESHLGISKEIKSKQNIPDIEYSNKTNVDKDEVIKSYQSWIKDEAKPNHRKKLFAYNSLFASIEYRFGTEKSKNVLSDIEFEFDKKSNKKSWSSEDVDNNKNKARKIEKSSHTGGKAEDIYDDLDSSDKYSEIRSLIEKLEGTKAHKTSAKKNITIPHLETKTTNDLEKLKDILINKIERDIDEWVSKNISEILDKKR